MIVLIAWLTCTVGQRAGAAVPPTEEQLERMAEDSPKVNLPKLIAYNEEKLERVYQAKLKAASPEYREALQKAQEAWRKFYEADLVVGAMERTGGVRDAAACVSHCDCAFTNSVRIL